MNTKYVPSENAIQFAASALTKAWISFGDGTALKRYSRDCKTKASPPDKERGIFFLKRMVANYEKDPDKKGVVRAYIYCNSSDTILFKYENGKWA